MFYYKKNLEMQFLAPVLPCQIQHYSTCNLQKSPLECGMCYYYLFRIGKSHLSLFQRQPLPSPAPAHEPSIHIWDSYKANHRVGM